MVEKNTITDGGSTARCSRAINQLGLLGLNPALKANPSRAPYRTLSEALQTHGVVFKLNLFSTEFALFSAAEINSSYRFNSLGPLCLWQCLDSPTTASTCLVQATLNLHSLGSGSLATPFLIYATDLIGFAPVICLSFLPVLLLDRPYLEHLERCDNFEISKAAGKNRSDTTTTTTNAMDLHDQEL